MGVALRRNPNEIPSIFVVKSKDCVRNAAIDQDVPNREYVVLARRIGELEISIVAGEPENFSLRPQPLWRFVGKMRE